MCMRASLPRLWVSPAVAERDGGGGGAWGGVGGQMAVEGSGDSRAELGVGAVRGEASPTVEGGWGGSEPHVWLEGEVVSR
jgi:hypothetical protein